jgi:uncharacterized protein
MFRGILYLLLFTVAISVIRAVIGIVWKAFSESDHRQPGPGAAGSRPSSPSLGELRADPVCGTFVATSTALQKKSGGEIYYFCSPECRDKFKA